LKINEVKRDSGSVELEFSGEGHTFLNPLQTALLEDPNVEMAGYSKPHPLMDVSRLFIKLREGDDVYGTLVRAAERLDSRLVEFLEAFEKSLSTV